MSKEFEAACVELQAGRITFDAFAKLSLHYWTSQARAVLRRWEHPSDVDVEDLVQVMLLEAWFRADLHEQGRASFRGYLTWNAIDQAKKFVHKQRGAVSGKGSAPSRHPKNFAGLHREGDEDSSKEPESAYDPRADLENVIQLKAVVDNAISTASDEHDACALAAFKLSGYDLGRAGDTLFEDKYCRFSLGVRDRKHASRIVSEVLTAASL